MTLEDFKDVYKDKTPLEMLKLLIVQTDYIRDDVRSMERDRINGNEKGADYMRSEIRAKEERIQWLYDQLAPMLKAQEPRVLSWDEVYANNRPFVVWHESRYGDEAEPVAFVDGEYVNSECTLYIEMNFANQRDYMADRDDGFRFWTAEPTFEQMEATPWIT